MLIVPFCARISFLGVYGDRPWANILDVSWSVSGSSARALGMPALATQADNTWDFFIKPDVVPDCKLTDIQIIDLDSASGTTYTQPTPRTGTYAGQGTPPNVAVLGQKITAHTRSQRNGRWYQCGVPKDHVDSTDPAKLNTAGGLAWATALDGIRTAMTGTFGGGSVVPVVISKTSTGPIPIAISSITPEGTFATQRRRLRKR